MASKDKKPVAKKPATTTKVTRISATDDKTPANAKSTQKTAVAKQKKQSGAATKPTAKTASNGRKPNVLSAIGGYFAGAWYELKQVNWPSRRATWSLTAAMVAFTGFFVVVILLLDALFKYLFQLMIG